MRDGACLASSEFPKVGKLLAFSGGSLESRKEEGLVPFPVALWAAKMSGRTQANTQRGRGVTVDMMIPVLNEAHVLEESVAKVREFFKKKIPCLYRVVVVDNGSTDGTAELGRKLSRLYDDVDFVHLEQAGRGRALRYSWTQSEADIVCYTDVDISTDLDALPKMLSAILNEGFDIAIGSRLAKGSRIRRCLRRELISQAYNIFLKAVLFTRFTDAQCGFKAVTREVVERILPQVKDQAWFFDTELLVLAEKQGYRTKDVPVVWTEDPDSRVKILKTAWEDIKGIFRLRWFMWSRKFVEALVVNGKQANL